MSISRELLGKVIDDVFDGAIEDASVIEEIYDSIKRHEAAEGSKPVGSNPPCEECASTDIRPGNVSAFIDQNERYPGELWWMERDAFEGWK